ncbi:MAG: iron chelate uptake ABC transporter family permease subunit, partial [Janthinobacterium lividum]
MPRPLLVGGLGAAGLLLAALSLGVGPAPLSPMRVVAAIVGHGDDVARIIVWQLRLPRALLALGVGAMLGTAGAALQGYLRNPLAEPALLGTSSAAALGAVIALYFGLAAAVPLLLPLLAIAGAILALAPLILLAGRSESSLGLILAGVAVS